MKSKSTNIIVSDYFKNQLNSRSGIKALFKSIADSSEITIDFRGIDFISRSSAHELLTLTDKLSNEGLRITFKNISSQPQEMLDKVAISIKSNYKTATFVNRLTFSDSLELDNYLLTL